MSGRYGPPGPGDPQISVHLDIALEDLATAGERAIAAGAVLADYQPQGDVRVHLDPEGHPFRLARPG
jgi:glyoxalase superfamily protein